MNTQTTPAQGHWYLPESGELLDGSGRTRRLEPRVAQVFDALLAHPGHVVSRTELLEQVWSERVVVDAVLTRCIAVIRAALKDQRRHGYIETLPKRGYRFVGEVRQCRWARCSTVATADGEGADTNIDASAGPVDPPIRCLALRRQSGVRYDSRPRAEQDGRPPVPPGDAYASTERVACTARFLE